MLLLDELVTDSAVELDELLLTDVDELELLLTDVDELDELELTDDDEVSLAAVELELDD